MTRGRKSEALKFERSGSAAYATRLRLLLPKGRRQAAFRLLEVFVRSECALRQTVPERGVYDAPPGENGQNARLWFAAH